MGLLKFVQWAAIRTVEERQRFIQFSQPRHPLLGWHTLEQHVEGWEQVTRDEGPNPVPIGCVASWAVAPRGTILTWRSVRMSASPP